MNDKTILIGCDGVAVELKDELAAFMQEKGYTVEDAGVFDGKDDTPYAFVAEKVARGVLAAPGKRGILLCGTGIGVAIAANKVPGIRAAQIHDTLSAERAALSNDANIVTLGARVVAPELAKRLVGQWLELHFKPGPSSSKIAAIGEVEQRYAAPAACAKNE